MTLRDKAFYNLEKNLPIEYVKTGEKDIFHSNYRLFDYWQVKEAVQEFQTFRAYDIPTGDTCDSCKVKFYSLMKRDKYKKDNYKYCRDCLIKYIFGDYSEDDEVKEDD